jgi:hypothetical protein
VLRAIVATIDRYGLRHRHLGKYRRDADQFFQTLSGRLYRTEVAEGYSKRLLKYQDKLFTFLRYDGVPWNNNAEHAIKRFADYREIADGHFWEAGLQEYLVLLSLYVTCEYKGLSLLQFLLSREKDIDVFCEGSGRGSIPPLVELLPEGYTLSRRNRLRDWDQSPQRRPKQARG